MMKLSKKAITAISFAAGACVFVSTALADMALGTGYDSLKGSIKNTAAQMEEGLSNYTMETMITLENNGEAIMEATTIEKVDVEGKASESSTVNQEADGETRANYSYTDSEVQVWKNNTDGKYYVSEHNGKDVYWKDWTPFRNPFDEEGFPEMEKILDAAVGQLKENVQAEENPEGGRIYSGTVSETQVPALVNAVASFGIKMMISDQNRGRPESMLPELESDVFVKKVSGRAVENEAGVLESLNGEVILSGKDKDGKQHDLTLNILFKLSDIGSTTVTKPDLDGENVEQVSESDGFNSKYKGTYKNNIVIEKDGEFVKIGERILEISSVEDDKVTGTYAEIVKPEFAADYPEPYDFTFEYNPEDSGSMSMFTYTNSKGEQESGQLHPSGNGKIYLDLNIELIDGNSYSSNQTPYFDGEFDRVFEN